MIPRKIHYCWFGGAELPELAKRCIASWHERMPDWEYVLWGEENFEIDSAPAYVREAYTAKKYAFVSDYVRLCALEKQGGVYLDTDVEVVKSFEPLLSNKAFIGFEETKNKSVGTNCIGSEANMSWLKELLEHYQTIHFVRSEGSLDLTTNAELITRNLELHGLIRDGKEQMVGDVHVFDHHYFSPITSTRVMRKNKNTFSIHRFAGSWTGEKSCWLRDNFVSREIVNAVVQVKRLICHCTTNNR